MLKLKAARQAEASAATQAAAQKAENAKLVEEVSTLRREVESANEARRKVAFDLDAVRRQVRSVCCCHCGCRYRCPRRHLLLAAFFLLRVVVVVVCSGGGRERCFWFPPFWS